MIVGAMKDQKLKLRILQEGRKNSTPSIGCHGHAGGTRSDQTRKTPKDLLMTGNDLVDTPTDTVVTQRSEAG
jgi:hypothetical protein